MVNFAVWIYYKNFTKRYADVPVAYCVGLSIAEPRVKRVKSVRKKLPDVT